MYGAVQWFDNSVRQLNGKQIKKDLLYTYTTREACCNVILVDVLAELVIYSMVIICH